MHTTFYQFFIFKIHTLHTSLLTFFAHLFAIIGTLLCGSRPRVMMVVLAFMLLGIVEVSTISTSSPSTNRHNHTNNPTDRATVVLTRMVETNWDPSKSGSGWVNLGYWQEANLVETMCNYLFLATSTAGNAYRSPPPPHIPSHPPPPLPPPPQPPSSFPAFVAAAIRKSFASYPGEWLVSTPPESTSYDDLLWWALAYIRAHELCVAHPNIMPCNVPAPAQRSASAGGPGLTIVQAQTPPKTLIETAKLIFDFVYNMSWNEDYCQGGFAWYVFTFRGFASILLLIKLEYIYTSIICMYIKIDFGLI